MLHIRKHMNFVGIIAVVVLMFFVTTAFRTDMQLLMDYNKNSLQTTLETENTNTPGNIWTATHTTSGTPAAGIGECIRFSQQTSAAGNMEYAARMCAIATDVAGASEDFDFVFELMAGGTTAAEAFRIASDGAVTWAGATTQPTLNLTGDTNQIVLDSDGTFTITMTGVPAASSKVVTVPNTTGTLYISSGTDVALADGGMNASLTAADGGIFYSTATAGAILAPTATATQMLQSGSSTSPAWSTTTWPATSTINQILYSSAANTISGLTTAVSGVLVTDGAGVPSIATDIPTAVTIGAAYVYRVGGTDVAVTDGGTGVGSWTDGQLLIGNTAGNTAALGTLTGTANQITVTNAASSITLSTPQDIETTSNVEFARVDATDLFFRDDFLVVDAPQWTTRTTSGSVAIQNAVNGTNRLTTGGGSTNEESLDFNDLCPLINTQRPVIEFRISLEQITNIDVRIGLYESAGVGTDNYIAFIFDASAANTWRLEGSKAGVAASDAGAVAATGWHTYRLEWNSDTEVEWYIDGVSQGTIATAANIPIVQLQPVISVFTEEAAAHYLDIDYFAIWQDRS